MAGPYGRLVWKGRMIEELIETSERDSEYDEYMKKSMYFSVCQRNTRSPFHIFKRILLINKENENEKSESFFPHHSSPQSSTCIYNLYLYPNLLIKVLQFPFNLQLQYILYYCINKIKQILATFLDMNNTSLMYIHV